MALVGPVATLSDRVALAMCGSPVELDLQIVEPANPRRVSLVRVVKLSRPPLMRLGCAIGAAMVGVIATLMFPILTKGLVDAISSREPMLANIARNPVAYELLAVISLGALCGGFSNYMLGTSGLRMVNNLKVSLFGSTLRREVCEFDAGESGELVSRLANDTQVIARLMTKELSGLFTGLFLLVGSAVALCLLDLALTGMIFGVIAVAFLVMAPIVWKMASVTKAINDATARLSAHMVRVFGEIRLVKAFTAEAAETERMNELLGDIATETRRAIGVESLLSPATGLALTAAMVVILLYGGARVQVGTLGIGTLIAFILYIFNVAAPLIQLSSFVAQLQASRGASQRIAERLGDLTESQDMRFVPAAPRRGIVEPADIVFENVEFDYRPSPEVTALSIETLIFPQRSRTTILGESGAGKTTLFSLLERFYHPSSGRITYGGVDIASFPLDEWRRKIGYVPQSAPLMMGTIRDNIAYGLAGKPNDEEIIEALRAANCADFVLGLERGLDTHVGEAGTLLSGGERQRLAIARMFFRDPEILLLDEPTSSLDAGSEAAVLSALDKLTGDRTTLMITHRETSISPTSRLVRLTQGRLTSD